MFYNTINLTGTELLKAKFDCFKQEEIIKSIYKDNPGKNISPSQIFNVINEVYKLNWPITSCRRAITCLTDSSTLVKTGEMVMGIFGKNEHTWKYKSTVMQAKLF